MKGALILVVDDEAQIRMSLSFLLRDAGYRVITVQNGLEALNMLSSPTRLQQPIDLILSDVRMPELSGIELIDEVSRLGLDLPFVIITAFGGNELQSELSRRGCFEVIQKPYASGELLKVVASVLGEATEDHFTC